MLHIKDMLQAMPNGAVLTGWFEYLSMEDETRAKWITYAITKAFRVEKKSHTFDDEEEVIDTTAPEFSENFRGFSNTPLKRRQSTEKDTQILLG